MEPYETGDRALSLQQVRQELEACNERSARFGLRLSERGIQELARQRERALLEHGRVEPGGSALPALIEGFCDSPYLQQEDYEATLLELLDAFYYYKNECGEQLTDDELIAAMRERYDAYDGSIDAVTGTSLDAFCRVRRLGLTEDAEDWAEEEMDDE